VRSAWQGVAALRRVTSNACATNGPTCRPPDAVRQQLSAGLGPARVTAAMQAGHRVLAELQEPYRKSREGTWARIDFKGITSIFSHNDIQPTHNAHPRNHAARTGPS
jgi:hypothetical protein